MATWIFQGNPDVFDVDGYLRNFDEIVWSVRQGHLASEMTPGDVVFFWRAAGQSKVAAGIVAQGRIVDRPSIRPDDAASRGLWRRAEESYDELRVGVRVESRARTGHHIVSAAALKEEPVLRALRVLRLRSETNYLLTDSEAARLTALLGTTGEDWRYEECLAGLWAYATTYPGPVSRKSDSPVVIAAERTGRSVSAVYNKVMNFRHLDPRDAREGLSGAGAMDQVIWGEFYDAGGRELRLAKLVSAFEKSWAPTRERETSGTKYKEFGPAPPDDPEDLENFARRVRRGQSRFREMLLAHYEGKCAVTGWGPEEVLQAAHIISHARTGRNDLGNGLLLRADIHELFDEGLLGIDPKNLKVWIAESLRSTAYEALEGGSLRPGRDGAVPRDALEARAVSKRGGRESDDKQGTIGK